MKEQLGRGAELLRKAVRHLANGSGTPQEKLISMYKNTNFGTIHEDDFPQGSLRDEIYALAGEFTHFAAMSDERAQGVIEQICSLSDAAAYALGRQNN